MVTKAEIQSIDYNNNICSVRMPFFESAGVSAKALADATFSVFPGSSNSYKVGDVVFVAFENGQMELPTVIGKLYLTNEEQNIGALNLNSLTVSQTAAIPASTKLLYDQSEVVADSNTTLNAFRSIQDLINAINKANINEELQTRMAALEERVKKLEEK